MTSIISEKVIFPILNKIREGSFIELVLFGVFSLELDVAIRILLKKNQSNVSITQCVHSDQKELAPAGTLRFRREQPLLSAKNVYTVGF